MDAAAVAAVAERAPVSALICMFELQTGGKHDRAANTVNLCPYTGGAAVCLSACVSRSYDVLDVLGLQPIWYALSRVLLQSCITVLKTMWGYWTTSLSTVSSFTCENTDRRAP